MRRDVAAAKRSKERREREDSARRLQELVPNLDSLRLEIEESREGQSWVEVRHTRHIVVGRAPALFDLPCSDRHCDGSHDVTKQLVNALAARRKRFEGRHRCGGHAKHGDCELELHFVAEAEYD